MGDIFISDIDEDPDDVKLDVLSLVFRPVHELLFDDLECENFEFTGASLFEEDNDCKMDC